ncbi:hypothetical protein K440DRAFT_255443 [Wilcoxina mikolae CBS 423.85]|nr:hypothetical protein K440DRAFT_255443 [Wilcoxina mikolae CBS 423.85]
MHHEQYFPLQQHQTQTNNSHTYQQPQSRIISPIPPLPYQQPQLSRNSYERLHSNPMDAGGSSVVNKSGKTYRDPDITIVSSSVYRSQNDSSTNDRPIKLEPPSPPLMSLSQGQMMPPNTVSFKSNDTGENQNGQYTTMQHLQLPHPQMSAQAINGRVSSPPWNFTAVEIYKNDPNNILNLEFNDTKWLNVDKRVTLCSGTTSKPILISIIDTVESNYLAAVDKYNNYTVSLNVSPENGKKMNEIFKRAPATMDPKTSKLPWTLATFDLIVPTLMYTHVIKSDNSLAKNLPSLLHATEETQ